MKFSIIVPTYNEEKDIAETLESLVRLDYPDYEILVVDDSNDNTPKIVQSYEKQGVRLIRPRVREGRCGARNLGILEATGEIVVILNADVHLPKDFLTKISKHYSEGADCVLVRSVVENQEHLFARYVEYVGVVLYYNQNPDLMDWTEGFSCRRQLAIKAGMFPTGFAVPICAGEDGVFGENLMKLGARKKVDLSLVITHVSPSTLKEYWHIRRGRGEGSPHVRRFIQNWSFQRIATRATLRSIKTFAMLALIIPVPLTCYKFARKSPKGIADLLPFCWAWAVEQIAFSVGEWKSLRAIYIAEKKLLNHREKVSI